MTLNLAKVWRVVALMAVPNQFLCNMYNHTFRVKRITSFKFCHTFTRIQKTKILGKDTVDKIEPLA